jgi:hypothetical protein
MPQNIFSVQRGDLRPLISAKRERARVRVGVRITTLTFILSLLWRARKS